MVKFPERLSTALDQMIAEAMAEYRGEKKVNARSWQSKVNEFKEARAEFYYGARESRVYFRPF